MLISRANSLLTFCGLLALALSAQAQGKLERFEKDATQARNGSQSPGPLPLPPAASSSSSARARDAGDLHLALLIPWLMAAGGKHSWDRTRDVAYDAGGERIQPKPPGAALIPYVRLDTSYRRVSSNLHGLDARAEMGYGPIGFSARKLRYREDSTGANLELWQRHVLYRMSAGALLEIDIGYGSADVRGVSDSFGSSWTMPVQFHPTPQWGIEYRPMWMNVRGSQTMDDELAISIGAPFWALRAGYHRLRGPVEQMKGPFIGFSVRL